MRKHTLFVNIVTFLVATIQSERAVLARYNEEDLEIIDVTSNHETADEKKVMDVHIDLIQIYNELSKIRRRKLPAKIR